MVGYNLGGPNQLRWGFEKGTLIFYRGSVFYDSFN